jgi:hypothetical protein
MSIRRQRSVAGCITVFIRTNPFNPQEPQYQRSASIKLGISIDSPSQFRQISALQIHLTALIPSAIYNPYMAKISDQYKAKQWIKSNQCKMTIQSILLLIESKGL